MKRQGQKVYNSKKWLRLRKAYLASKNYICERCGRPARVVHHKEYLTADNVDNAEVAYCADNLEALCLDCHNLEHNHFQKVGAVFTSSGDVAKVNPSKDELNYLAAREIAEKL